MRVTRRESLRLFSSGLTATAVSLRDRPYDCLLAEKALDRAALLRLLGTSPVAAPPFAAERVLVMDPEFPVTQEAAAHVVPMAHNFCLTHGVQWSTRELCRQLSRRLLDLAIANKLFSEEERADIVALVAADPECGDLIRGTGGFRKVRVARKGMGKSGGARVVYIWRNERFPVFLITVFPKNEKENLSMAERNTIRKRADSIFEDYGR